MKKIINICCCAALLAGSLVSCSDFLDEQKPQGLLLEDGIIGIGAPRQLLHQETLRISLVASECIVVVKHVGDGLPGGILGNQLRVT